MTATDERLSRMRTLREQGFSDSAIGKAVDLSRQTVYKLLGPSSEDRRKQTRIDLTHWQAPFGKPERDLPGALTLWRARHNLTQPQAAAILHISSPSTYSKWERGAGCSLPGLVIDFIKLWEFKKEHEKLLTSDNQ